MTKKEAIANTKGRGTYKCWTSRSILRVAFGDVDSKCSPLAFSTHASGYFLNSSTTYVQRLRDGLANFSVDAAWSNVATAVARVPVFIVMELSFDETAEDLQVGSELGPQTTLMMHVRRLFVYETETVLIHVSIPTAVLLDATAESISVALRDRVPMAFQHFRAGMLLVLNSDSAESCKRVARHFHRLAETVRPRYHLHSRCQQHLTNAALVYVTKQFQLLDGSFCSTVQLHKGAAMRDLRQGCHAFIKKHLRIAHVWDPTWDDTRRKKNKEFANLLLSKHCDSNSEMRYSKRERAVECLLSWLPLLWFTANPHDLLHYCPYGCCQSREEAVDKICNAFDSMLLGYRPRVPAVHRWTKLFQPWSWWLVAFYFFSIIPVVFMKMEPVADCNAVDTTVATLFGAGASSSAAYQARERARWRKATQWLGAPHTVSHLTLMVSLMQPILDVMHHIFDADRSNLNAIHYATLETSPPAKAIVRLFSLLQNNCDPFWTCWSVVSHWSQEASLLALTVSLQLVGHLYMRCVLPFMGWPWKLAKLVNPLETPDELEKLRREIGAVSHDCDQCLDSGFGAKILELVRARHGGLFDSVILRLLYESFSMCPVSNVPVETRFARQRNYGQTSRGRSVAHTTVASNHVLSELRRLHRQAVARR